MRVPAHQQLTSSGLAALCVLMLLATGRSTGCLWAAELVFAETRLVGGLLVGAVPAVPDDEQAQLLASQRRFLNEMIFRADRRQQRDLKRAIRALQEGKTADGLAYLQGLLNAGEDGFVWLDSGTRLASVRAEASRVLSSLDPSAQWTYERLYGPEARRRLREARNSGDSALYGQVIRRFFHTSAGFAAMNWQASRWMDHGHYSLAARGWWRLLSEPAHRRRVTPTLLLKAALAYQLCGRSGRAEAILARIRDSSVAVAGKPISPSEWLSRHSTTLRPVSAAGWPMAGGNAARSFSANASTPYLRPIWSRSYLEKPFPVIDQVFEHWTNQRNENSRPVAVANSAIVVGNRVVVRDFESIRALDLATGRPLWSYRCDTSVARIAAELARAAKHRPSLLSPANSAAIVQRTYAENAVMGMLASDGRRVYAIDSMDLAVYGSNSRRDLPFGRVPVNPGSLSGSPETNRLIALEIDVSPAGTGGENRPVWSIGGGLPLPERFVRMDVDQDGGVTPAEFLGTPETFKQFDTSGDGIINRIEADTVEGTQPLAGHFFLGPPLPIEGRLYTVTESNRQLNLVALKPETGQLLWSQGIGFVTRGIETDENRYPLSCSPSFADGVVVCPTQVGILVGVDAMTGSPLWAYYYGDKSGEDLVPVFGQSGFRGREQTYGHPGFPSLPQIRNGKIVYMPPQSKFIHCVDLHTGRRIWRVARENPESTQHESAQDEYVAALTSDVALIVGGQHCRGLSLSTGEQKWSLRLGMPSGVGVRVGAYYLLPLEEGRIATIDTEAGKQIGFSQIRPAGGSTARSWHDRAARVTPRNLVAGGDVIVSAGVGQMSVFPQSAKLLARTRRELNSSRTRQNLDKLLLCAELELMLGRLKPAKSRLARALASSWTAVEQRRRAELLMRELLYLQLRSSPDDELSILQQLDEIAKTPRERGRYLIERVESQLREGDFAGVLGSTSEFASLSLHTPLPMAGDASHLVSAGSWVPAVIGRVRNQFGDAELASVNSQIDVEQLAALSADRIDRLEQFLAVYSRWPQADPVRTRLAQRLVGRGRFQQAELLLLENRRNQRTQTAAIATAQLARLWDRLGCAQQAAGLLAELEGKYAEVYLDEGRTGRDFVQQFPRSSLTWAAYRQAKPLEWPVRRVHISEQRWIENQDEDSELYGRYRRHFLTSSGSPFLLLNRGVSPGNQLSVIDRQSGVVIGNIAIPPRTSYPSPGRGAHVGHFFPLGSTAAMNGISLLELADGKPLWTTVPEQFERLKNEPMRVGPAGPSFCAFQGRRHLVVVNPATGRILWQRTDLDPGSGLISEPNLGLFGDEEALVLFSSDRASYTVYRTATGEELRHGKLEGAIRHGRHAIGRKLFYSHSSPDERRLRCWDPLWDRLLLDEPLLQPVPGRVCTTVTSAGEVAAILRDGRLRILDGTTGRTLVELAMESQDLVGLTYTMRVFSDHANYYVNLPRTFSLPRSSRYSYYASRSFLPAVHVQGDLYAIERKTGKLLWKRRIPQRSVILMSHFDLPFLVMMARQSDRSNHGRQSLLVEVLDARSGDTIGLKDNIYADRIVHLSYQRDKGRIEMRGLKTKIRLDFQRRIPWLAPENRPL